MLAILSWINTMPSNQSTQVNQWSPATWCRLPITFPTGSGPGPLERGDGQGDQPCFPGGIPHTKMPGAWVATISHPRPSRSLSGGDAVMYIRWIHALGNREMYYLPRTSGKNKVSMELRSSDVHKPKLTPLYRGVIPLQIIFLVSCTNFPQKYSQDQ